MKITGFFGYQYLQKLSINRLQRNNLQEKETSETAALAGHGQVFLAKLKLVETCNRFFGQIRIVSSDWTAGFFGHQYLQMESINLLDLCT